MEIKSQRKSSENKKYDKQEIKNLFREYNQTKNKLIREELIKRHMYIAEILSKKYSNKGIEYDDIYQIACLGLIYAVDRFDVSKGYEFSSFATPTIIGEIKKYFRDKGWAIRVPRRIQELSQKVNLLTIQLSQEYQRAPTVAEISEYLKCSKEEVLEAMEASKVYSPQSLDIQSEGNSDEKEIALSDIIGEDDKEFENIENSDYLKKVISNLNNMEKKIIRDRYFERKTQIDIAKDLGISQMTVSRMEKKILKRFKKELEI